MTGLSEHLSPNGRQVPTCLDDPVRIGVVGLGYWGPNLVRNLLDLAGADIVWVCDSNEARLKAVAHRYPAIEATRSLEDLLNDTSLEAIAIATPVSTHYSLAAKTLDAGKHVFIEKPLADSSEKARKLIELATARGLVLMPGHTFLYSPAVNKVQELIRSGELGEIYFISTSRVNLGLHQPDVSVAWDLGPHDFSILYYWLREVPEYVAALSRGYIVSQTPDVAFIHLEFPSGVLAHVELSWLAPSKLRRTAIVGSRKMAVYDDTNSEPVRVFNSSVIAPDPGSFGEYQLSYRTGDIVSPYLSPSEPLLLEMADFCAAIRYGITPQSSAEVGLIVVEIIEAVDQSLARGGDRVALEGRPRPATADPTRVAAR